MQSTHLCRKLKTGELQFVLRLVKGVPALLSMYQKLLATCTRCKAVSQRLVNKIGNAVHNSLPECNEH